VLLKSINQCCADDITSSTGLLAVSAAIFRCSFSSFPGDRLPTGAWLRGKIGVLNKGFQTTRCLRILSQLLRGIMDQGGFDQGHVSSTHMKCHQTSSSLSHATPKFNRLQCFN
jgi:hypothetical protein